jgi:hypothetical protein
MVSIRRLVRFVVGGMAAAVMAGGCMAETGTPADEGESVGSAAQELQSCAPCPPPPTIIDCKDSRNNVCLECSPSNRDGIFCCILNCKVINKPLVRPPTPLQPVVPVGTLAQ